MLHSVHHYLLIDLILTITSLQLLLNSNKNGEYYKSILQSVFLRITISRKPQYYKIQIFLLSKINFYFILFYKSYQDLIKSMGEDEDDLKWLCKIMDHDLKINIGAKYVLGALHPDAYDGK